VSHVLDIKPGWKEPTVRRALFRMVDDGRVRQFERLGEWLYEVP
jgi:DNA-binding transcriptional regulator PaaX